MGGWGSGRRFDSKSTTDDYIRLDVRRLQRDSVLERRYPFSWKWTRNGKPAGDIVIRPESDRVFLIYRSRTRGGDWENLEYPVQLERMSCHLGGERVWFRCPARGCGRRAAILYGGRIFACRTCQDLAYECQHEQPHYRALRKAQNLSIRLGGDGCVMDPVYRPKGMHQRTFASFERRYDHAVRRANAMAFRYLGVR